MTTQAKEWTKNNLTKKRDSEKTWRAANRGKMCAHDKAWRQANPDKHRARVADWQSKNPDRVRANQRIIEARKRAQKRAAGGNFTKEDVADLEVLQGGRCAHRWCKVAFGKAYHIDHIMPLAKGGSNGRENIQLLCIPCNQHKHDADPIEYTQRMEGVF